MPKHYSVLGAGNRLFYAVVVACVTPSCLRRLYAGPRRVAVRYLRRYLYGAELRRSLDSVTWMYDIDGLIEVY